MTAAVIRTCISSCVRDRWLLGSRFREQVNWCSSLRSFHYGLVNFKRRKTAEERKAPKIIEYSPKKSNRPTTSGVVGIWRYITVQELATVIGKEIEHVQEAMLYVKDANNLDPSAQIDDMKVIKNIVNKCGLKTKIIAKPTDEVEESKDRDVSRRPPAPEECLKSRPPVVTVMGHVDHGKTTLLDSLRGAEVAASEAGGITQHIGAFIVKLESGEIVTFLDTPGHAAFSAMRARGAHLTDIIVLVVAADDGVMDQTKEVVKLALAAEVPIIVAVNKIDKPEADLERTKRGLMQLGISLEGHGGDTQVVGISALHSTNLEGLSEAITLEASLMGLKSEYTGPIEGIVVESKNDSRRGKLATVIVTRGTLRKGAIVVCGEAWAKVRGLFDDSGVPVESVTPGHPVEILGWRELPFAGDELIEVESEKKAHSVMRWRQSQSQKERMEESVEAIKEKEREHTAQYIAARDARRKVGKYKMRRVGPRPKESGPDNSIPSVNVIIKGDVHGSVEAILDVLETYDEHDKCKLNIVHYGVGNVSEGDIELASTFDAIVYAFSVEQPKKMMKNIAIREVNIIYRLVDNLKEEIGKKLPQIEVEEAIGEANVLQLFSITEGRKEVTVMGSRCVKGTLKKSSKFKLMRQGECVHIGPIESMRHLKNEVDTIKKDVECGLRFADQTVIVKPGDAVVCFTTSLQPQQTEWDPGF